MGIQNECTSSSSSLSNCGDSSITTSIDTNHHSNMVGNYQQNHTQLQQQMQSLYNTGTNNNTKNYRSYYSTQTTTTTTTTTTVSDDDEESNKSQSDNDDDDSCAMKLVDRSNDDSNNVERVVVVVGDMINGNENDSPSDDSENDNGNYLNRSNYTKIQEQEKLQKPSSEDVLNVAFYSFVGFMVLQGFVAYYIAHSTAMMADCMAMSVDAITYLFNLYAEQCKQKLHVPTSTTTTTTTTSEQQLRSNRRRHTLYKYYYEFIPPTISIVTLVVVTIYTIRDSITTIIYVNNDENNINLDHNMNTNNTTMNYETTNGNADNDDVSIPIMLLFSFINLILDLVNVSCFSRSGFFSTLTPTSTTTPTFPLTATTKATTTIQQSKLPCCHNSTTTAATTMRNQSQINCQMIIDRTEVEPERRPLLSLDRYSSNHIHSNAPKTPTQINHQQQKFYYDPTIGDTENDMQLQAEPTTKILKNNHRHHDHNHHGQHNNMNDEVNLNMCSAWTHVCADTMRSMAVLIAAGIAMCIQTHIARTNILSTSLEEQQQYYASMADSIAALVVSIIILLSIVPLLQGLYYTGRQIFLILSNNDCDQRYHSNKESCNHYNSLVSPTSSPTTTIV